MRKMKLDLKLLPTQYDFLTCTQPFPAYIGGYGAGKTFINSVKAIVLSIHHNQGLTGLLVAPNYRDLRDTNIPTLLELLDSFKIPYVLHKTNYDLVLPWWNSRILLRSAEHPEKLKGPNVAWAGIDEVARTREQIWGVVVSRVRHPKAGFRQAYATGTPEGLNWVFERWVEEGGEDYALFQASTRENIHLDPRFIEALQCSHDEHETRQKLDGQFSMGIRGQAYKNFDRSVHLRERSPLATGEESQISPHLPVCVCCDFNVDPCCWVILQHYRGVVWVADEIILSETSTQEMIAECRQREYLKHEAGVIVYGDPAGNARNTATGGSDYALIRQAGIKNFNVARRAPSVRDRVLSLNYLLDDGKGNQNLFIHPQCSALIRDLERVTWKEGSSISIDKSDLSLTHASDALGYFVHKEFAVDRSKAPGRVKISQMLRRKRY